MKKNNSLGFTLIEVMTVVAILGLVFVSAFQGYFQLIFFQNATIGSLDVSEDVNAAIERFVVLIKEWGLPDYEEYWNRTSVSYDFENEEYFSENNGHLPEFTGYGNFGRSAIFSQESLDYWESFYYCVSYNNVFMGYNGCQKSHNNAAENVDENMDFIWAPQRYGQYALQHIDYNGDKDNDFWDEDDDGSILFDSDDELLGKGPETFVNGQDFHELYLIKWGVNPKRYFFRWNIEKDTSFPDGTDIACFDAEGDVQNIDEGDWIFGEELSEWCRGNIQMLVLEGRDYGFDHIPGTTDSNGTEYDGYVDTWVCTSDYCDESSGGLIITGTDEYMLTDEDQWWVDIFPSNIHIKHVVFEVWPSKDVDFNWWEETNTSGSWVHPYVRINMTLALSQFSRNLLWDRSPEFHFSTTINLPY